MSASPITIVCPAGSKAGEGRIVQTENGRFKIVMPAHAAPGVSVTINPADFTLLDLPRVQHRPPCWACLAPLEWDRAEAELCKACNVVCTHCGALSTPPRWRKVKRKPYLTPMRALGWGASGFNVCIMPVIMLGNMLFAVPWWARAAGWSRATLAVIEFVALCASAATLINFFVAVKAPVPAAKIPAHSFAAAAPQSKARTTARRAVMAAGAKVQSGVARDGALAASQLRAHFAMLARAAPSKIKRGATAAQRSALAALLAPREAAAEVAKWNDAKDGAAGPDAAARADLTAQLRDAFPPSALPLLERGTMVGWSWCYLSGGPKPPRAHYSHTDGACIPAMDHFCPYLGACVGAHNHAPFLRYIISLWAACAYLLSVSLYMFPAFIEQLPVRAWGLISGDSGYHQDLYYFCQGAGAATGRNMVGAPLGGAGYSRGPIDRPDVRCALECVARAVLCSF